MNMNTLMQQVKSMQKDVEKTKEEINKKIFTAKQPLVEVEIDGNKKVKKIKIDPNITTDDIEVLEDMIVLAINEASSKISKELEEKLGKFGPGVSNLL